MALKRHLLLSSLTSLLKLYSGSLVFIIIARYLSLENFGALNFGFSLGLIVGTCAEFGYSLMSSRDIPQEKFDTHTYVINTLIQKVFVSFIISCATIIYVFYFISQEDCSIALTFMGYGLIASFVNYYLSLFRAKGFFKKELFATAFYASMISFTIILAIIYEWHIELIGQSLMAIKALQLIFTSFHYHLIFKSKKGYLLNWEIQRYLGKNALSFGLHFIIGTLYFQTDTQIINYYCGNEAVGLYQAPFKLIMVALIGYDIIFQVYLPYISKQFIKSHEITITNLLQPLMKYLLMIAIISFLVFIVFHEYLISSIFGSAFKESGFILVILGAMVIVRVIASVYGILLTVSEFQSIRVKAVLYSLTFSIFFNLLFIPKYGVIGAAWVSLATHLVLLSLYYFFVSNRFKSYIIGRREVVKLVMVIIILLQYLSGGLDFWMYISTALVSILVLADVKFKELSLVLKYEHQRIEN